MRFASHRDVARAFERGVRRAGLPIAYSAGFTPHPKIVRLLEQRAHKPARSRRGNARGNRGMGLFAREAEFFASTRGIRMAALGRFGFACQRTNVLRQFAKHVLDQGETAAELLRYSIDD